MIAALLARNDGRGPRAKQANPKTELFPRVRGISRSTIKSLLGTRQLVLTWRPLAPSAITCLFIIIITVAVSLASNFNILPLPPKLCHSFCSSCRSLLGCLHLGANPDIPSATFHPFRRELPFHRATPHRSRPRHCSNGTLPRAGLSHATWKSVGEEERVAVVCTDSEQHKRHQRPPRGG